MKQPQTLPYSLFVISNLKGKLLELKAEYPDAGRFALLYRYVAKLLSITTRLLTAKFYLSGCTSVGKFVTTNGKPLIRNEGQITIGDHVAIWSIFDRTKLLVSQKGKLTIGAHSRINGTHISAQHSVTIGNRVRIGPYTLIMDSDFHDVNERGKVGKMGAITIDDDVWIASRVTILKGVRIGTGAMVAAGSVVTKDVAPRTLVAGVPAKFIKHLKTA